MLTQLATVKARLAIPDTDPQFDVLLTSAIAALSARFDRECNRTLARTVDTVEEFDADQTAICVACYPIETVTQFELNSTEAEGWQEIQPTPAYLIRQSCVISLTSPLDTRPATLARVTYTGGHVLPGATPGSGQTPLPADLEQAAVEQAAYWYQTRDKLGVMRQWPKGGTYEQFADLDLLPNVRAVLKGHQRWRV